MYNNNFKTLLKSSKEPIAKGFLRSVQEFSGNNAIFVNNHFYTYKELFGIVFSIHKKIPAAGKYEQIGIYCNNDIINYASILAVNLYGAAYVPLNCNHPVSKNKTIVEQCNLSLILTSTENDDLKLIAGEREVLTVFDSSASIEMDVNDIIEILERRANHQTISYILFTSGSTGNPKGVPVSHSNLNCFFDYFLSNYDFNSSDKFLQVYELTFDVSIFSFFMPLLVGACCCVLPTDGIKSFNIINQIKEHKISVLSMVPTTLNYFEKYMNEISLPSLRYCFFSGDALYHHLTVKWSSCITNAQIHNFYGPTETTIVCTRYEWNELQSEKESVNDIVPLGKPFSGMEFIIIDDEFNLAEKGELCFSGTQVISEYLNGINADCFFHYQNKIYYKTGDVVSINSLGNLVFYGRTDSQVKINGYRTELKEIEFAIGKLINKKTIVMCIRDGEKSNSLIAFVETGELNEVEIKEKLISVLPDFMIPRQFVAVSQFPFNDNGKVDKNKLLLSHK